MESKEFIYLSNLVKTGRVRFGIIKSGANTSLSLWLMYKNNQTVLWIYSFFRFFISEWFWVPFSIFLAWWFQVWWIVIAGIAFSWIIDELIKNTTYGFLPDNLARDENLLNYFWKQNPPRISIQSTELSEDKLPMIVILPPRPWQTVIDEFKI